jgi:hypothetical protein
MPPARAFTTAVAAATLAALGGCPSAPAAGTGALAYTRFSATGGAIAVTAPGSAEARLLIPSSLASADPAWSPDGRHIAFTAHRSMGASALFTMLADGSGRTRITPAINAANPSWAPDGRTSPRRAVCGGPPGPGCARALPRHAAGPSP